MFYERRADRLYQLAVTTRHGIVTVDIDARGTGTLRAVCDWTDNTANYVLLPDWDASMPLARQAPETRAIWETWLRSPDELSSKYGLVFTMQDKWTSDGVSAVLLEAGFPQATHVWVPAPRDRMDMWMQPRHAGPRFEHYNAQRHCLCVNIAQLAWHNEWNQRPTMLLCAFLTKLPSEVAELIWHKYALARYRACTVCDAFSDFA